MDRMAKKAPKYNGAVDLYIEKGVKPGSFLKAVLENNLMYAFANADYENIAMMREWAGWLYNYGNRNYFGSKKIVEGWIEVGGAKGFLVVTYRGKRLTPQKGTASKVLVELHWGFASDPWRELPHIEVHSPGGYTWGYAGSGPADMALSILAHHINGETEPSLYQSFKNKFVATWGDTWEITSTKIQEWIDARKEK